MKFLELFKTSFSVPKQNLPGSGGRPGRSTGPRVSRPTCTNLCMLARSTGSVDQPESFALWIWAVDRTVDRLLQTVKNMTVGGRPAGLPPAARTDKQSQRLVFDGGLFKPHFFGILAKVFKKKNFPILWF